MAPANGPTEEEARASELAVTLLGLATEVPAVRDNLKRLAAVLSGTMDEHTMEVFARLEALAATTSHIEFHEVARASYENPELFKSAWIEYERARRLTGRYPELQSTREYLGGLAKINDPQLMVAANGLLARLTFASLWAAESALPALLEQVRTFRDRYGLAYRTAHRDHHEAREAVAQAIADVGDKLTVIDRLNGLELGAPIGARLADEVRALAERARPCVLKDTCRVDERPRCNVCGWDGQEPAPQAEADELIARVKQTADDLCKRVAQEAIRKILEQSGEPSIRTLLEMITAARVEDLARVLTPDAVAKMKSVLAASNIEHRDLSVTTLLEDLTMLEEDRVDEFLARLRDRLRTAFDKARRETEGKKRVRFFLK
jgi:hypothetical protein